MWGGFCALILEVLSVILSNPSVILVSNGVTSPSQDAHRHAIVSHTQGQVNPKMQVFGLCAETGRPGANPCRHRESMQSSLGDQCDWELNQRP